MSHVQLIPNFTANPPGMYIFTLKSLQKEIAIIIYNKIYTVIHYRGTGFYLFMYEEDLAGRLLV